MGKIITTAKITGKINGITVNTSKPCNAGNYTNSASRLVEYIVVHYTGNKKDTAKANANYFQKSGRGASAHFFVDNSAIYQSVDLCDKAWHCGTSGTYYHTDCRNSNSFGIEMCCTAGNYKISDTTKKNGAYLCAQLCKLVGITAEMVDKYVLRHYDVTHKKCPAQMAGANNKEWAAFKDMVRNILKTGSAETKKEEVCTVKVRQLKSGDEGDDVKALQLLLIGNGYSCGNYGADGSFGNETLTAVKKYQKAKGLTADGIVGAKTWNKLLGV